MQYPALDVRVHIQKTNGSSVTVAATSSNINTVVCRRVDRWWNIATETKYQIALSTAHIMIAWAAWLRTLIDGCQIISVSAHVSNSSFESNSLDVPINSQHY